MSGNLGLFPFHLLSTEFYEKDQKFSGKRERIGKDPGNASRTMDEPSMTTAPLTLLFIDWFYRFSDIPALQAPKTTVRFMFQATSSLFSFLQTPGTMNRSSC